jgi:hypothetical protein
VGAAGAMTEDTKALNNTQFAKAMRLRRQREQLRTVHELMLQFDGRIAGGGGVLNYFWRYPEHFDGRWHGPQTPASGVPAPSRLPLADIDILGYAPGMLTMGSVYRIYVLRLPLAELAQRALKHVPSDDLLHHDDNCIIRCYCHDIAGMPAEQKLCPLHETPVKAHKQAHGGFRAGMSFPR